MTVKYDTVADAVYVALSKEKVAKTVEVSNHMMMDLDASGNTVGIEILEASSQNQLIESIKRNVENGIPVSITTQTPTLA